MPMLKSCEYTIDLKIRLSWISPPHSIRERIERDGVQAKINNAVFEFLESDKNCENLVNAILIGTGSHLYR